MIRPIDSEKWQQVFLVFDRGIACEGCPHHREWKERHPYGEGSAYESLRTCAVISSSLHPERCPSLFLFSSETETEDEDD